MVQGGVIITITSEFRKAQKHVIIVIFLSLRKQIDSLPAGIYQSRRNGMLDIIVTLNLLWIMTQKETGPNCLLEIRLIVFTPLKTHKMNSPTEFTPLLYMCTYFTFQVKSSQKLSLKFFYEIKLIDTFYLPSKIDYIHQFS